MTTAGSNINKQAATVGLITDFGNRDYFSGVLKGVIKRITPGAEIIDINNEIPSYNLYPACFTLEKSYRYFPSSTIFLVIVDPGVGTDRKILLVEHSGYFFIGPDNGVLTPILQQENKTVSVLDQKKYFLIEGKSTFEGRDKMAPAAAYLASGVPPKELASPIQEYKILKDYYPVVSKGAIEARIVYIDKFGNIVTNVNGVFLDMARQDAGSGPISVSIQNTKIYESYQSYGEAEANSCPGPFILMGSHGNIEIAVNRESAADLLQSAIGDPVVISF